MLQKEIRELKADMERKISDAQKDAALTCANAVAEKEREMDRENARLQAQIENFQAKIVELTTKNTEIKINIKSQGQFS